jgi:hypothetical protein
MGGNATTSFVAFRHFILAIRDVVVYCTAMALRGVVVCCPAMAIRSVILSHAAMALHGVVFFSLTATGIHWW